MHHQFLIESVGLMAKGAGGNDGAIRPQTDAHQFAAFTEPEIIGEDIKKALLVDLGGNDPQQAVITVNRGGDKGCRFP